jgi:hypothetical protein
MKTRPVAGDAATIAYHADLYRFASGKAGVEPADFLSEPLPEGYQDYLDDATKRTITLLPNTKKKMNP